MSVTISERPAPTRRAILRSAAALGGALMAGGLPLAEAARRRRRRSDGRQPEASGPPNFVVVVADDMAAGDWEALTQTRRLLADEGTTFPNFILSTPICGPSRATLFTGQFAHNHGVIENNGRSGGWAEFDGGPIRDRTINVALQDAGYRTGLFGKFMNGAPETGRIAPGWSEWASTSELDYVDFDLNENGKRKEYRGARHYSTDVLGRHAVKFIRKTAPDRPFLLVFTPKAPKGPATPAPEYESAYRRAVADRSAAFNEADMSDKPAEMRSRRPLTPAEQRRIDEQRADRLRTMLSLDDAITDIVVALEEMGRLANTYIMVMSDNGYALGDHRLDGKGRPYDPIVRVPMVMRGPGIRRGFVDERVTGMVDVAPTIAAAAETGIEHADGASLLDDWNRAYMLIESWSGRESYTGLRSGEELYVEYASGEREHYDHTADPDELENQLADWDGRVPTLDPLAAQALADRLAGLRTCAGRECLSLAQ